MNKMKISKGEKKAVENELTFQNGVTRAFRSHDPAIHHSRQTDRIITLQNQLAQWDGETTRIF